MGMGKLKRNEMNFDDIRKRKKSSLRKMKRWVLEDI